MNDIIKTASFDGWGYMELAQAAELLSIYAESGCPDFIGRGMTINFNSNSGYVFISDEDYNVGIVEDGKIVQFYSCGQCGYENTQREAMEQNKDFIKYNGFCSKECEVKN